MDNTIKKYPVCHAILKEYIRFFCKLHQVHRQFDHKIFPQKNIYLRLNWNDNPSYTRSDGKKHLFKDKSYPDLHNHSENTRLNLIGMEEVPGDVFYLKGFTSF